MASIDSFSLQDRILSCLPTSITECLTINPNPASNSSTSNRDRQAPELEGLLSNSDDYDDSDAISLLSNIADSDSNRRSRSRRNRNRLRRGAGAGGGLTAQLLACGLFGRSKSQIQQRPITVGNRRHRQSSGNGADSSDAETDESEGGIHSSLRDVDSGDEDAGMLKEDTIAKLAKGKAKREANDDRDGQSESGSSSSSSSKSKSKSKSRRKKEKQEEKERKRLQEEADKKALEQDERLAQEEQRLAQEEEAAIAKARRKAERRAAKAGLLKFQNENSQRRSRGGEWRTEAGAEAAAGGFHFAEEDQEGDYQFNGDERYGDEYADYDQEGMGMGEGGYQFQQEQIIHHHHHYYNPSQQEPSPNLHSNLLSPNDFSSLPALPSPSSAEDQALEENPVDQDDEDEADIAGLSFGKKKRRNQRTESQSGGSGNGSRGGGSSTSNDRRLRMGMGGTTNPSFSDRRRGESFNSGSQNGGGSGNGSGNGRASRGLPALSSNHEREIFINNHQHLLGNENSSSKVASSSSSNSSTGRASYRDKPRRHERNKSTSNSSRDGLGNRIHIPNLNNHHEAPQETLSNSSPPAITSPNSIQAFNPSNLGAPSDVDTSASTEIHSSRNFSSQAEAEAEVEESEEFNYQKFSNSFKSKARKGSSSGQSMEGSSSNGSSSAAASRRARGIPPIHEESSTTTTPKKNLTTSPQKLHAESFNLNLSDVSGLNSARNPNGADSWRKFNQQSSQSGTRRLEEEEVDGL